ncbi:MAG: ZIP family metal transporter [Clostridiales bacterium]|nr:ZIP family metal transporter [Clostridiales bacterium]
MWVVIGLAIPLLGTALGAAIALVCKRDIAGNRILIGLAAGAMLAASVWSLLLPSLEMGRGKILPEFFPAAVGFMVGVAAMLFLEAQFSKVKRGGRQGNMLLLAMTAHNVPEGMAVGAVFAGLIAGGGEITLATAVSLSLGIALQNVSDGAIVSLPLLSSGYSKDRAFWLGTLSGAVEPIAALITIALHTVVIAVLPYFLSFAAGAMIYVTARELIPDLKDGKVGILGLAVGFVLMMILDCAL